MSVLPWEILPSASFLEVYPPVRTTIGAADHEPTNPTHGITYILHPTITL
jgi:hypothetical protein